MQKCQKYQICVENENLDCSTQIFPKPNMPCPGSFSLISWSGEIILQILIVSPSSSDLLTVSSISSPSFLTWKGHHPFTLLCLNRDICGTLPSCFNMLSVHCLEDFAPLGNWFRSRVSAPETMKDE